MTHKILLHSVSPHGGLEALVEADQRVAFLYLHGDPETTFGVRSCWVRNLGPAPLQLDVAGLKEGLAPMLPARFCSHAERGLPIQSGGLEIVWFEAGDGVALLENGSVLAIIPNWSGEKGFHGFARDCQDFSPLCWPLHPDNIQIEYVCDARAYWKDWEASLWPDFQTALMGAVEEQLGAHSKYYAIDGNGWPPKALIRIDKADSYFFTSVGLGIRAQPMVDRYSNNPGAYRRFELGICLDSQLESLAMPLAKYLSAQSNLPWTQMTWLGPYHTVPCNVFAPDLPFSHMILVPSGPGVPELSLPAFRGDPIHHYWMFPITLQETQFAKDNGGTALCAKLFAEGHGLKIVPRKCLFG